MRFLRSSSFAVILVVTGVAAVAAGRWFLRPRAVIFARAAASPEDAREIGGAWYWVERPGNQPQRLVRAAHGSTVVISSDETIIGFDAEGSDIAWTAKHGKTWRVMRTGSRPCEYTSSSPVGTPRLWRGRLYWAVGVPPRVDPSIPLPALGPSTAILAADPGGKPTSIAELPVVRADVIGHTASDLCVVGKAGPDQDSMAIYVVPVDGSTPQRVAAETEVYSAAVAHDGTLYWVAPSCDSSDRSRIACVRRARAGLPPEVVQDWLPAPGDVYAIGAQPWYVTHQMEETAWRLTSDNHLPDPVRIPVGLGVLAAGASDLLLHPPVSVQTGDQLYLMRYP